MQKMAIECMYVVYGLGIFASIISIADFIIIFIIVHASHIF